MLRQRTPSLPQPKQVFRVVLARSSYSQTRDELPTAGDTPRGAPTRLLSLGSFSHRDGAGNVTVHFSGRVRGRKLRPGRYLLALTPRANGKTGRTVQLSFRIVK